MAREQYIDRKFTAQSLALISTLDAIITDYQSQGYVLTVRQLYYQLVAKGVIPNTERSYKAITSLVNDARLAGLLDWSGIEDRTRSFIRRSRWNSGSEIIQAVARQYHQDMWAGQEHRVFVIVEKEALAGVLEGVCNQFDVPLLAARGYPSSTVLREFAERDLLDAISDDKQVVILHLGDHDPSGIDMTRDLTERLDLFTRGVINLQRIALTMPQIDSQKPPPNPAKTTDSRFADYMKQYGHESWELDALTPTYLVNLVKRHIKKHIDDNKWEQTAEEISEVKTKLLQMAEEF